MLALDLLLLFAFAFALAFTLKPHKNPEPVALGGDAGEGTQKHLNLPIKQSPKHWNWSLHLRAVCVVRSCIAEAIEG